MPHKCAVFESKDDCTEKLGLYFDDYLPKCKEIADIESLADYLKTTRETLSLLKSDTVYGDEIRKAYNKIAKIKKQLAFAGKLPAAVLSFDMRNNHGYSDKNDSTCDDCGNIIFKGKARKWAK